MFKYFHAHKCEKMTILCIHSIQCKSKNTTRFLTLVFYMPFMTKILVKVSVWTVIFYYCVSKLLSDMDFNH